MDLNITRLTQYSKTTPLKESRNYINWPITINWPAKHFHEYKELVLKILYETGKSGLG